MKMILRVNSLIKIKNTIELTLSELKQLLKDYIQYKPKVRGISVIDYSLTLFGDGSGKIEAELSLPKMNTNQFALFLINNIPYKAYAEFGNLTELKQFLICKKEPIFILEDEI